MPTRLYCALTYLESLAALEPLNIVRVMHFTLAVVVALGISAGAQTSGRARAKVQSMSGVVKEPSSNATYNVGSLTLPNSGRVVAVITASFGF
jgi:hypothetical protein